MLKSTANELAEVKGVFLGREDHGIFTFYIHLDYGGMSQSFGGYALDTYDPDQKKRIGHASGADMIMRLMDLFGVDELTKAVGKVVYAIKEGDAFGPIIGLRTPKFDGDRVLLIDDWRKDWGFKDE